MIRDIPASYFFIGLAVFILVIYNSFATYDTLQNPAISIIKKMRITVLIWFFPFLGAYLANKSAGFKINLDNIDPNDNFSPRVDHDTHL